MPSARCPLHAVAWACLLGPILASGCGERPTGGGDAATSADAPLGREDQALYQELENRVNDLISENTSKYAELRYEYSEGLLKILDQIELTLSGKFPGEPPRLLAKLDPDEEREHLRETVRRWEAKTGKSLRTEVDARKAEMASRPAGQTFHPEFQRKFSQAFDEFIAIEVAELRERRNRAIHAAAEPLLAPHRAKHPEPVRRIERILDSPPYRLTASPAPPRTDPGP